MQYVVDQLARLPGVSSRKMFGEYSIYLDGKVVGLVADDQFFVKTTQAGGAILGTPNLAAPYPGAKLHFLISDVLDDSALLCRLIQATFNALPAPMQKAAKKAKSKKP